MAQLVVRRVDPALVRALKLRAAQRGRSAEAEHREILRQSLSGVQPTRSLKQLLMEIPKVGTDRDFVSPRDKARPIRL